MKKKITVEEVAKHNKQDDCWVIIDGRVYDVTAFLEEHPGGIKPVVDLAGKDASQHFHMLHKPEILEEYGKKLLVGEIATESTSSSSSSASSSSYPSSSSGGVRRVGDLNVEGSETESWTSGGTAGELPAERSKATFKVEKMTNVLDGGEEATKKRRWILAPLQRLDNSDKHNKTRQELIAHHFRDFISLHKPFIEDGYLPEKEEVAWMSGNSVNSGSLMPHMSLFLTTILGQGSADQIGWWLWRALTFQMIGSYAQTELGHGSNVRGLRTTATYDKTTQEFVLNTPTLQSMKWWNSGIGVAATHAAVYAQLIIDGKEYGVHVFMLQLRDENHNPIAGIEVGDVGPKLGDHGIDTGFMRLKDVRIPREHLFAKRQHVEPDGTYVKHVKDGAGGSKLHYLTMMSARAGMISIAGAKLAIAVTTGTRYSCVRRQGFMEKTQSVSYQSKENQIMDYQVQQYRLFKQIANAYSIKFTGHWMAEKFGSIDLVAAHEISDAEIADIHASSSGLKALTSTLAADGIEDVRKCCGGHGFLLNSGVAALAADYVWQTTAEGDHVVMLLQTARYLVKSVHSIRSGKTQPSRFVQYLAPLSGTQNQSLTQLAQGLNAQQPPKASNVRDFFDLAYLLALYRYRALLSVVEAAGQLHKNVEKTAGNEALAWNLTSVQLMEAARCHCFYFLLSRNAEAVEDAKAIDDSCTTVLQQLCGFWANSQILDGRQWFGIIDREQAALCDRAIVLLLKKLRPNAVALVDAFDIHDSVLQSTLGRKDGNVYEALYKGALSSRLNKQLPFHGYHEHLRPSLDLDFLRLHNQPLPEVLEERPKL